MKNNTAINIVYIISHLFIFMQKTEDVLRNLVAKKTNGNMLEEEPIMYSVILFFHLLISPYFFICSGHG